MKETAREEELQHYQKIMTSVTVPVHLLSWVLWEPRLDVNDCIESWILNNPVNLRCSCSILHRVQRKRSTNALLKWSLALPWWSRRSLCTFPTSESCCSLLKTKAGQSATRMKGPTSVFLLLQLYSSLPFSLSLSSEMKSETSNQQFTKMPLF